MSLEKIINELIECQGTPQLGVYLNSLGRISTAVVATHIARLTTSDDPLRQMQWRNLSQEIAAHRGVEISFNLEGLAFHKLKLQGDHDHSLLKQYNNKKSATKQEPQKNDLDSHKEQQKRNPLSSYPPSPRKLS